MIADIALKDVAFQINSVSEEVGRNETWMLRNFSK